MTRFRAALAALTALLAAVGVSVSLVVGNGTGPQTITVKLGSPSGQHTVLVPEAAVEEAEAGVADHGGSRSEIPPAARANPAVFVPMLNAAQEQQEQLAASDQLPIVSPLAAPRQEGCITRTVGNKSSRRGVRPRLLVYHETVSPNRPGWSDVLGIVSYFDRPSSSASSHYVGDAEGNCAYIVPENEKAWTQATYNPVSISWEQVNTADRRRDSSYAGGPAGLAKIGKVCSDITRRWEIPIQLGLVAGGRVIRPGIVDHRSLGPLGGGHVDISPFQAELTWVIAACQKARGAPPKPAGPPAPRPTRVCTVRELQRALNARGAHLVVDGIIGPRTRAAIVRYRAQGLRCPA